MVVICEGYSEVVRGTKKPDGPVFTSSGGSSGLMFLFFSFPGGIHWYLCWQLPVGQFLGLQEPCLDASSGSGGLSG